MNSWHGGNKTKDGHVCDAGADVLHNDRNYEEEKEDLDTLRCFGGIEKSTHVVSIVIFFPPCPFHRGLHGLPSAGSLLPKSHLEMWGWAQGNPQ